MLMSKKGNDQNPILKKCEFKLNNIKQDILSDPALFKMVMDAKGSGEDKKSMKLAKKEVKKKLKEMQMTQKQLSSEEIKQAQLLLSSDIGEGNLGQFLKVLFIKLMQFIKKTATAPFKKK